jgi:outer membrane receptor protein involved in Fe transport
MRWTNVVIYLRGAVSILSGPQSRELSGGGVRLLADGIPATSRDQAATFDLNTAKRIEVLRGPFSALYGNSSGGVIAVFTVDGPPTPTVTADVAEGSFGTSKAGAKFGGQSGGERLRAGELARGFRADRPAMGVQGVRARR